MVQRRLAAIMVADVAGYSRLMERDEAGTLAALQELLRDPIGARISAHGGRIVKTSGDGVLMEFSSVVAAVEAAIGIQRALAERNRTIEPDRRLALRIGINLGDVIVEGDDLFGAGVNIASRLQALAEPGGICLSEPVHQQIAGKLDVECRDLGLQSVKNIAQPLRAFAIELESGPAAPDSRTASTEADRPSLAVLPFANMSGDAAQEYFSDGITEDIITDLSRWRQLTVLSRNATFRYKGKAVDPQQIGRELGARYLLEGSVRKMGERVRITAQLVDCETGGHLWAERFDRDLADVFAVQDEVARIIVGTLVGRVQAAAAERSRRKPPSNMAAYDYVLRGNALPWDDPVGAAEAVRLFEKAIEIEPRYAIAHACLATILMRKWRVDLPSLVSGLDRALELASRAVALDGDDGSCHMSLSRIHLLRGSFDLASRHGERAIEINPNNQWTRSAMATILANLGRADEAIELFRSARQIDPFLNPPWYWHGFGFALMLPRHYDEALACFTRVAASRPFNHAYMAGCHAQLGQPDEARACAEEYQRLWPDFTISRWLIKEPLKIQADRDHLVECLRKAGLPE